MMAPFQSLQFATYEYLRKAQNLLRAYDPITHSTAEGIAEAVTTATTTPLDVTKTLLQTRREATDIRTRNCYGLVNASKMI